MTVGLTPSTSLAFYLFIVDAYSRFSTLYGLSNKSSKAVITALQHYLANGVSTENYEYVNLERIRADAGSQFTSQAFIDYCVANKIHLSVAAPKKQNQYHIAEWTWQTICGMARSLLVHAHLLDTFWFHALCYASAIFNVLPICVHTTEGDIPCTPYQLYYGQLPCVSSFRVFRSPVVVKRWVTEASSTGKLTERGTRGIFIGFPPNQKGYLVYCPGSRQILVLDDVLFGESFQAAIATTWQQYQDSLALQPVSSAIPDVDTTLEQTGTLENIPPLVEEKTTTNTTFTSTDTHDATLPVNLEEGFLDLNADDNLFPDNTDGNSLSSDDSQLVMLDPLPPEEPQPPLKLWIQDPLGDQPDLGSYPIS